MQKISFHNADVSFRLTDKKGLKQFIPFLFQRENVSLQQLSYVFCSDDFLLDINQQHLQHDFYTDIITFDLSESDAVNGEIYISIERVKENALNLNAAFEIECLRVLFHGALHLCGYKDKTKTQQTAMRKKEEEYIELYLLRQ